MHRDATLKANRYGTKRKREQDHRRCHSATNPGDRVLLLAAAGRAAQSGGQTTLYLTPLHGKANMLKLLMANIRRALQHIKVAAEQITSADPAFSLAPGRAR